MGRNSRSRDYVRWPSEVDASAQALLAWALANAPGTPTLSPFTAAMQLITANMRERMGEQSKPDGRTTMYAVRIAAVDPKTQTYLAAFPWMFDIPGMDAVWRYVSEHAWQLYDGMDAPPMELLFANLVERTNTARVAMSRRSDGVSVLRVRFQWHKRREKRNLRRDAAPDDVQVTYEAQDAQVNVWIGTTDDAKELRVQERAAKHPLAEEETV